MAQNVVQAYRKAPWRRKVQWIGRALLVVVFFGLGIGINLYVSSLTAEAGLNLWKYENQIAESKHAIGLYESQLAQANSITQMEEKVAKASYYSMDKENAVYIVVPGYLGRQPLDTTDMNTGLKPKEKILIRPSYTQSLLEWLSSQAVDLAQNMSDGQGVQP